MARPKAEQPTPGELEILKVLWERGSPATVRDVMDILNGRQEPARAYTSVMSLMNVMAEKGLLRRSPHGRAFLYEPATPRDRTLRSLLGETLERAYEGSASLLVAHLLDQSAPTAEELGRIRSLLDEYESRSSEEPQQGGAPCRRPRTKRSSG
ncbi:Transcriptional regulator BlaI [Aquisphaera giovannonii]|uniref:Transcriptional regulator BlaI n=1 Tax=Aquisphaera giovannonii TaxID=406548 RepID=A0A5B9WAG3_9BACT|nr:BlaI/MecI/CopY family transcriptional regulator [Aquisphaera giovannonii]QEH37536.1 Transcriptional regulator BlaI [Aquisphaera giovannonii]